MPLFVRCSAQFCRFPTEILSSYWYLVFEPHVRMYSAPSLFIYFLHNLVMVTFTFIRFVGFVMIHTYIYTSWVKKRGSGWHEKCWLVHEVLLNGAQPINRPRTAGPACKTEKKQNSTRTSGMKNQGQCSRLKLPLQHVKS